MCWLIHRKILTTCYKHIQWALVFAAVARGVMERQMFFNILKDPTVLASERYRLQQSIITHHLDIFTVVVSSVFSIVQIFQLNLVKNPEHNNFL